MLEKPGKLTLDKADGSTWWARRGEAEREIQVAAKELAKHIAKRRRRRAPKLVAPGAGLRKIRRAVPVFHDARPGQGDSGRPGRSRGRSSHGPGDLR